jgi:hypothetical protein
MFYPNSHSYFNNSTDATTPNTHLYSKVAMQSFSANSLLASALESQKPSDFAFVTITNPSDIRDSKKQSVIRRHARASTTNSKRRRRQQIKLVFDLPDPASQVTAGSNVPVLASSVDTVENVESTSAVSIENDTGRHLSFESLRPIGSGRGLHPLQPFPVAANARLRHLTNFSLNLTPFNRSELI